VKQTSTHNTDITKSYNFPYKTANGWITVSCPPLFTLCRQIWHLCTSLWMTDPTIPVPIRTHNTISLARKQQHVNLLSKLLIHSRKVTPNKNRHYYMQVPQTASWQHPLLTHCPGLISQIYLTAETLIAAFSVGQLPHLGWYMISVVNPAITGTWGLTEEAKRTVEGRREAQRNVACYYRNRPVDR
jgi:hypothetical protein